ncbi:MAG: 7-carboxy-7-deazaguanine synthase QueE [Bacteroidota bacterium]
MIKLAQLEGSPEIFYTIQGEGKNLGKPSIFIRTSLCNLHCVWCDTDYTWNWKGTRFSHVNDSKPGYEKFDKSEWVKELESEEVLATIQQFPCKNIVITGGEPLLQQTELYSLCKALKLANYCIEIETNGTRIPEEKLSPLIDQYNVSPKLENSNNPTHLRIKPKVLHWYARENRSIFKFVLDSEKDLTEVLKLQKDYKISPGQIYLMPQGTTADMLDKRKQWVVEICKSYGFNFTDRLHVQLWGDKKGV